MELVIRKSYVQLYARLLFRLGITELRALCGYLSLKIWQVPVLNFACYQSVTFRYAVFACAPKLVL